MGGDMVDRDRVYPFRLRAFCTASCRRPTVLRRYDYVFRYVLE
jgi:hypothetical protein